jgi:hypothetical protein
MVRGRSGSPLRLPDKVGASRVNPSKLSASGRASDSGYTRENSYKSTVCINSFLSIIRTRQ